MNDFPAFKNQEILNSDLDDGLLMKKSAEPDTPGLGTGKGTVGSVSALLLPLPSACVGEGVASRLPSSSVLLIHGHPVSLSNVQFLFCLSFTV